MATVDELILKVKAEGSDQFVNNAEKSEKAVESLTQKLNKYEKRKKDSYKSTLKNDDNSYNSRKKIFDKEVKQKEKTLKDNKALNSSLSKILKTMFALSGLSFTLNGIQKGAEASANSTTGLANEGRGLNINPLDLESLKQAMRLGGSNENALSTLAGQLSLNKSQAESGRGFNERVIHLLAMLSGNTGESINYINTDPLDTLKKISEGLLRISDPNQRISVGTQMGLTNEEYSALTNLDFSKNLNEGIKSSIFNEKLAKQSADNKKALEASNKELDNAMIEAGSHWTNASIKLTAIYTKLAKNSAKLSPLVEDSLNLIDSLVDKVNIGLETLLGKKGDGGIYGTTKAILNETEKQGVDLPFYEKGELDLNKTLANYDEKKLNAKKSQENYINEYLKNIKSIDNGEITFKDDTKFSGGFRDYISYPSYLYDALKKQINNGDNEKISGSYNSARQEKMDTILKKYEQNPATNNITNQITKDNSSSNEQNFNISEVIIQGQQVDSVSKFGDQVSKQANTVVGISPSSAFNLLKNTV